MALPKVAVVGHLDEHKRADDIRHYRLLSRFFGGCWVLVRRVKMIFAVVGFFVAKIRFHKVYGIIFLSSQGICEFQISKLNVPNEFDFRSAINKRVCSL